MWTKARLEALYYGEDKSLKKIAQLYDCSYGKIWRLFTKLGIKKRLKSEAARLQTCRHTKHPNLAPSADLFYILGVLKGDGYYYSYKNRRTSLGCVALSVNDLEFAQCFAQSLSNIRLRPLLINLRKYNGSTVNWRVAASSVVFADWLRNLTLVDLSEIMRRNRKFRLAFFKGFYESEGSFENSKKNGVRLRLSNTNKPLLKLVQSQMRSIGYDFQLSIVGKPKEQIINGHKANFRKLRYSLGLYKRNQIKTLLQEVVPAIPRKRWSEN